MKSRQKPIYKIHKPSFNGTVCKKKVESFVFIKTHKSGSTTLTSLFQKFAFINNLYMMVSTYYHNNHLGWPYKFEAENNIVMPAAGKKFNALVNHVVYNRTALKELMHPDTAYVTVLREATSHLLSAYHYFGVDLRLGGGGPESFTEFLTHPQRLDSIPDWLIELGARAGKTHIKSLTRNLQSADLGFEYRDHRNETAIKQFIARIVDEEFDFILILEKLSESLVLMKRKFCWTMSDIVRISKNIRKLKWGYSDLKDKQALRKAYEWVNVDKRLYVKAKQKLEAMLEAEKGMEDEVMVYENINNQINTYCGPLDKWDVPVRNEPEPLIIGQTPYSEEFVVDRQFCVLLLLKEEDLTFWFKCKQFPHHSQCVREVRERLHIQWLLTGGAPTVDHKNVSPTRRV